MLVAGDPGYDEACRLFNERVVTRPAAVARCASVADVRAALAHAREHELPLAVRCGGHGVAGWASVDDGLVVDLRGMREVAIDPEARTAWVGGGCRAGDVLAATAPLGLAPVTGVSPGVGLGGLLTGLGEGYLTPRHGFGIDNVLAFELVTADERVLHVSADEHPELFWALRGAGANFGVVTAMQLRLHPLPEHCVGGWITFAGADAAAVSRHVWQLMRDGSPSSFPLVLYEPAADGLQIRAIPGHIGPRALAEREVGALRACAPPLDDTTRAMSYVELVHEIAGRDDEADGAPARRVWDIRRFPFDGPAERQMALLLELARQLTPRSHFNLWRTVPVAPAGPAGAAPRLAGVDVFLSSRWDDAAEDARELAWVEETAAALDDSGLVGEAANAMNHTSTCEPHRVRRLYGEAGYARLMRLKAEHDAGNRFRRNYNVPPAPVSAAPGRR